MDTLPRCAVADSVEAATAEAADGGVEFINHYGLVTHRGCLRCQVVPGKGRTLVAMRDFNPGDVILEELPLHIVQEEEDSARYQRLCELCEEHNFAYEPLWYWCALKSLSATELGRSSCGGNSNELPWAPLDEHKRHMLEMLHPGEERGPGEACIKLKEEFGLSIESTELERLLQVWIHNTFDYSDEPQGYATYFFPSFMSHSCYPSALWHYSQHDNTTYVLRARRRIRRWEEVTVSYLDETLLLDHAPARRWDLKETKQFWCLCERCAGAHDRSRGMKCIHCREGSVFAWAPGHRSAEDGNLQVDLFVGAECSSCSHKMSQAEAQQLNRFELSLQRLVDSWEERDLQDRDALNGKRLIAAAFTQHSLVDRALVQVAKYYKKARRWDAHCQALEERSNFQAAAYPGLSAERAWTMEAHADGCRKAAECTPETARLRLQEALRLYGKAYELIFVLFGDKHEYTESIRKKVRETQKQLGL
mmetsp:Transcript_65336/g.120472  ORF Transcript_65336/g.120472 Transcript_65336/m.120472 type:complete len:478 (+) Transcript_65336:86-1519(+)